MPLGRTYITEPTPRCIVHAVAISHTNNLIRRLPWYPVFGNHDYGFGASGVQAQIDRYEALDDDLWVFPATNYSRVFRAGKVSVQIVFIDTTTLAPSENKCCNANG